MQYFGLISITSGRFRGTLKGNKYQRRYSSNVFFFLLEECCFEKIANKILGSLLSGNSVRGCTDVVAAVTYEKQGANLRVSQTRLSPPAPATGIVDVMPFSSIMASRATHMYMTARR